MKLIAVLIDIECIKVASQSNTIYLIYLSSILLFAVPIEIKKNV